jgi:diguanylate cyclase (GGDEF)-like protein
MIWIRDLSIACKFFLAAIPLLFLSIIIGIWVGSGLQVTQDGLRNIVEVSWVEQDEARDLRRNANLSHNGLFRFVAWSSAGLKGEVISGLADEITSKLNQISAGLEAYKRWRDLSDNELKFIEQAQNDWDVYARTARDILDIGKGDAAVATVMLAAAHDEFEKTTSHFSNLNESIYNRATKETASVLRIAKTTQVVLLLGAAALLAAMCFVSYCLYSLILAPVAAVTRVMLAEAEGKDVVPLPPSYRKDEIGQMVESISLFREKTEASKRALFDLARRDVLTGLPNRLYFREFIESRLSALTGIDANFALLLLDLDLFKAVNDTRGHATGDEVLKQVADRLRQSIGPQDLISRLGGDEFAIILSNVSDAAEIQKFVDVIGQTVRLPYTTLGEPINIGTSIGIAVAPTDGTDTSLLLKRADLALYQAKNAGRNTSCFFEEEAEHQSIRRRLLESDLAEAIENDRLRLFYQPIVSALDQSLECMEALIRWNHPERGPVPPSEFIPIIENMGLMPKVGDWVLRAACLEASHWPETVSVAVNISALQIGNGGLLPSVRRALGASGLAASRLEVEITESVLLQDSELTLTTLQALQQMGVRVSLDDFGTGFNSLQYLRCFPVNKIKIDQSFVRDDGAISGAIIRAIVELGHSLGLSIVAEGIETEEQFQKVRDAGCTQIQGYLTGRPGPAEKTFPRAAPAHAVAA